MGFYSGSEITIKTPSLDPKVEASLKQHFQDKYDGVKIILENDETLAAPEVDGAMLPPNLDGHLETIDPVTHRVIKREEGFNGMVFLRGAIEDLRSWKA